MDLLLLALLVALAVWGARKLRAVFASSRTKSARAAKPGYSPDNPIVLTSRNILEDAQAAARCECGGKLITLGETTRHGLRVARGRCRECESDVDLYFVLPQMLN